MSVKLPKTSADTNLTSSESTRDRILNVALNLFGQFGYAAVSVRQICEEAKVNIAAVNYHFQTKENLFLAVDKYISDGVEEDLQSVILPAREFIASGSIDADAALDHLLQIHGRLIELIVPDSAESDRWARFYIRTQLGEMVPASCNSSTEIQILILALIGVARGKPEDERRNGILAASFFGQILVFRVKRTSTMAMLKVDSLAKQEVQDIKQNLLGNIRAILASDITENKHLKNNPEA